MTTFGYSPDKADRIRTQLDRDLSLVEFYLDRIGRAIPQAGATVSRLDDVRDTAREVVSDLHDVVDGRTEVPA